MAKIEKRELRVYWDKKEEDITYWAMRGPDRALAHGSLSCNPINPAIGNHSPAEGLSFLGELERRGYDLTTLKMSIDLRADHPWIRPGATLYPKKPGVDELLEVDWVRYHGPSVRVYVRRPGPRTTPRAGGMPDYGGGFLGARSMSVGEVELKYQSEPVVEDVLDIDAMVPMFPVPPAR